VESGGCSLKLLSKKTIIRYQGKQYYKDRTIPAKEKAAIRRTYDAYRILSEAAGK
jgi:hypothetical protein